MRRFTSRYVALAAVTTIALGTAFAVPSAQAHPFGGWGYHHGYGYGAAGLGIGLGLGALAAATSESSGNCYIERREFLDRYDRIHVRRVRVCD